MIAHTALFQLAHFFLISEHSQRGASDGRVSFSSFERLENRNIHHITSRINHPSQRIIPGHCNEPPSTFDPGTSPPLQHNKRPTDYHAQIPPCRPSNQQRSLKMNSRRNISSVSLLREPTLVSVPLVARAFGWDCTQTALKILVHRASIARFWRQLRAHKLNELA
jgi:hypothetical protein